MKQPASTYPLPTNEWLGFQISQMTRSYERGSTTVEALTRIFSPLSSQLGAFKAHLVELRQAGIEEHARGAQLATALSICGTMSTLVQNVTLLQIPNLESAPASDRYRDRRA